MKFYRTPSELDNEDKFHVHRTPVNFHCMDGPFAIYEVDAENVEGGAEESYWAQSIKRGKLIPMRDIAKISAKCLIGSKRSHERTRVVVCEGDALLSVDKNGYSGEDGEAAICLGNGNSATTRRHSTAIALGEHCGAVAAGDFSDAIAVSHGSNAAASGPLSNALALEDGWAISGNGDAVALRDASAVAGGSHNMALACSGKAYAFGYHGRAISGHGEAHASGSHGYAIACLCHGKSIATGRLGVAVALSPGGTAECHGSHGLAIATGHSGKAKGALGSWLVLAERNRSETIVNAITVKVDGESIKPDTWYTIKKGKVVPA